MKRKMGGCVGAVVLSVSAFWGVLTASAEAHAAAGAKDAGRFTLFDRGNYPQRPKAHGGAELKSDYATTRRLDVAFHGKESFAQIRVKQGEVPGDVACWSREGATLVLECAECAERPLERLCVEISALDWSTEPRKTATLASQTIRPRETVQTADGGRRYVLSFKPFDAPAGVYTAETLRLVGSGEGRLVVTNAYVTGPGVAPSRQRTKRRGSEEHLWLRVKGRRIVTSPKALGGERPFVAAGAGYGKNVIMRGYDELVASYCASMGLNTIRLAFYNQYFN